MISILNTRPILHTAIGGLVALGGATAALAHHSFAQFDRAKTGHIAGTVKVLEWTNPHTWLWVVVSNPDKTTTTWGFEGAAPGEMSRHGWNKRILNPGDRISIDYHPMKSGKPGGSFITITLPNGRKLDGGGPPMPAV